MASKKDVAPTGYYRQERKRLPYTVTDIGGQAELEHWKAEKARLEEEWRTAKAKRKQEVIQGMEDGSLLEKQTYVKSETTKAYKRYERQQTQMKEQARKRRDDLRAEINDIKNEKTSIFTTIYNWCMDKFLSIKL